jgi:hypothetical protein
MTSYSDIFNSDIFYRDLRGYLKALDELGDLTRLVCNEWPGPR